VCVHVGCHESDRDRRFLDQAVTDDLADVPAHGSRRQERPARDRGAEHLCAELVEEVGGLVGIAEVRVEAGDDRADARPGEAVDWHARFLQSAQHADVGIAAHAACARATPT
jgi:hypothetical protein